MTLIIKKNDKFKDFFKYSKMINLKWFRPFAKIRTNIISIIQ